MLIYQPSGKAREYSPLALNIYSGGCDHACDYCYCKQLQRGNWGKTARPRNLSGLAKEAEHASRQILLSFIADPYCLAETTHRATRKALHVLSEAACSVAILSKGGTRCLCDLDLFSSWPDSRVEVGATLTFLSSAPSVSHEPGAAIPADRIEALRQLSLAGINTWASIEPVLDPVESIAVIEASLPFVSAYKVGKLNHRASSTDWSKFCIESVSIIRSAGRKLYVKDDLRPFAPAGFLRPEECTPETVFLPDRPSKAKIMLPGF